MPKLLKVTNAHVVSKIKSIFIAHVSCINARLVDIRPSLQQGHLS